MEIKIEHIYGALRDSVRYYPRAAQPCKFPQTWRVFQLSLATEIEAPNLGATVCDKDKPYFYSRRWVDAKYNPNAITFDFPLVYAFEKDGGVLDIIGGQPRYLYNLEIGVVDILSDDKAGRLCEGCNSRTINEIYADTQQILEGCIGFLKNVFVYRIDGGEEQLLNRQFAEQALAANSISVATRIGPAIMDASAKYNERAPFSRFERSGKYGTWLNIQVALPSCQLPEWNFAPADFGIISHEAGCKNC